MAIGDLVTKDWEMEYNGLQIGGDTNFAIAQIDGLMDLPDLATGDLARGLRHGVSAGNDWMRGRSIRLTIEVYGDDAATLSTRMHELTSAFAPAIGEQALVFQIPGIAQGNKVQMNARVRRRSSAINREWYYNIPIVVIELYATEPYLFDTTTTNTVLTLDAPEVGLQFNIEPDIEFVEEVAGLSLDRKYIVNSSGVDVGFTVTFAGPVTNPRIINTVTGEFLECSTTVASGEELAVDFYSRTVYLGAANRYYTVTAGSNFWELPAGTTLVRFAAESYTSATATVTTRSAYI